MKKILLLILCVVHCALCVDLVAQNREFRATWLTTVWGIDWPKTTIPVNGTDAQKEYLQKVD